jgi:hypothetical protein
MSDILAYPEKPWHLGWLSRSPNITFKDVMRYPEKDWNWTCVSENPNVSLADILTHKEKDWSWCYISGNANITLKDILKYPNMQWHYDVMSDNKFLYNDFVYKNNLKSDIKTRREKVKKLSLFGSLESLVAKYVGYL